MGKSLMSIGVIAISINWIVEAKFREKWNTLKQRKHLVLIVLLFFFTHLAWGVFSSDFDSVLDDLRRKLPFLALPITIGTSKKLSKKELLAILGFFLLGLMISAGIGLYKYFTHDYENYRDLSVFISHIRFGLFLGFGIGVAAYLFTIIQHKARFLFLIPVLQFLLFIRVLGSGTGYFAGGLALILSLIYIAKSSKQRWLYISSISSMIVGGIVVVTLLVLEYQSIITPREGVYDNPPKYTAEMNLYEHYPDIEIYENGYPVYMNYCPSELEAAWNARSSIPIDSVDEKGQLIQGTIIRYMTSLNLKKDAEGVAQLTENDVAKIESGINSVVPPKSGFRARLEETILEYVMFKNGMNPNGHSIVQRIYYLEAGWSIAKNNLFTGVTIGDEEKAYQDYYAQVDSPLTQEHRLRAHNQILSFLVCFGAFGTLFLLLSLLYPILQNPINFLSILFLLITLVGFLSDDMLNRQAGVTFVALFYCLIYLSGTGLKRNDFVPNAID